MKTLYRLLLLMIIGFFTTTLIFLISPVSYKDTIVKEEKDITEEINSSIISMQSDTNLDKILINPSTIVINHIADSPTELAELPNMIFSATILKDGDIIAENISNMEIQSIRIPDSKTVISSENPLSTTLDISKENLFLSEGTYQIKLTSNIIKENENNEILINVKFESPYSYIQGSDEYPTGKMAIRLYFADKNYSHVIPITRFIDREYPLNKQIIYELQNTIKSESFGKTIDEVNYCVYSNENTYIDLPRANEFYNNEKTAKTAYTALIKSMYAMSEYLECNAVRFTVDNAKGTEYFNGVNIESFIEKINRPKIYLGYVIDKYAYLYDMEISEEDMSEDLTVLARNMFAYYNKKRPDDLVSPFNNSVELLDVKVFENNLTLNFNKAFLEQTEKPEMRHFMIDSLTTSFTSIEEINTINITIDGEPLSTFIDETDLSGKLSAPEHINIESKIIK